MITAAFIGTALELIRFSELFVYALKLSLAHSSAEKTAVRKVGAEICKILYSFYNSCIPGDLLVLLKVDLDGKDLHWENLFRGFIIHHILRA